MFSLTHGIYSSTGGIRTLTPTGSSPSVTPASFTLGTYTPTLGSRPLFVFKPKGYDDNIDSYPATIFYHGDGATGNTTTVTGQTVTGVGLVYSGNFTNSINDQKVLTTSVEVTDNSGIIGRGYAGGVISGATLSGTMNYNSINGSFTFTLTSAPSGSVKIKYQYSKALMEGLLQFVNGGDFPEDMLVFAPVNLSATDFNTTSYYTDLKTHIFANYRVDSNRLYLAGLSRGSRFARTLLQSNYAEISGIVFATMDYGGTFSWTNYSHIGMITVQGTADSTLTNQSWTLATAGASSLDLYPKTLNLFGTGHSSAVWNTNVYNRATAPFDYIAFLKRNSKNREQRGGLFTEFAESKLTIEAYREALIQVNLMTGATKSSLLTRLSTVRDTINAGGRRFVIDHGVAATPTASGSLPTGLTYNNMSNNAAGQTLSNLVDDSGTSSTYSFSVVSNFNATGKEISLGSNRGNMTVPGGFQRNTNTDGLFMNENTSTGAARFTGLPSGKTFELRIYHNEVTTNFSVNASASFTVEGVTKTQYSAFNTLLGCIVWTGTVPSDGQIDISGEPVAARSINWTVSELWISP